MNSFLEPGLGFTPGLTNQKFGTDSIEDLIFWMEPSAYNISSNVWVNQGLGDDFTLGDGSGIPSVTSDYVEILNGMTLVSAATTASEVSYVMAITLGNYLPFEEANLNYIIGAATGDAFMIRRSSPIAIEAYSQAYIVQGVSAASQETILLTAQYATGDNRLYKNSELVGSASHSVLAATTFRLGHLFVPPDYRRNVECRYHLIAGVERAFDSESERQKIEGLVCHEAGLTSLLPVTHPYKTKFPET